jgi:hypothetical protein
VRPLIPFLGPLPLALIRCPIMPQRTALGRLALRRVQQRIEPTEPAESSAAAAPIPWSRELWGIFLPERRKGEAEHQPVHDRRKAKPRARFRPGRI